MLDSYVVHGSISMYRKLAALPIEGCAAVALVNVQRDSWQHGDVVLLPRITLDIDHSNSRAPFDWKRRQFPIQVAFVLSLNKVQGQSMECVGIDFTDACFAHGQHYTGSSCVGHPTRLRYFVPHVDSDCHFRTHNVVYQEILRSFEGY